MIFIIGCSLIVVLTVVAVLRSKKPLKSILLEAKYELIYNAVGSRAMLQDIIMRSKNKTDLPIKSGRNAVITGGTRGIGLEVIKMLLKCDINVIIGCRNLQQGEALLETFRKEGITKGNIDVFKLDISVISSVKDFADAVREKYKEIHYLINNAGIMFGPYIETRDGYESQFSTNYLGHFYLTHLLLRNLKSAGQENDNARIVNVSSCAHVVGDIKFEDINNRNEYISGESYAQSKLAQVLFTNHLENLMRQEGAHVQVHSVHPGIVNTDLFNGTNLKTAAPWAPALIFKSPEQGARPVVHACLSSDLEGKGGTYIHNCTIFPTSHLASSTELQEKLFNFTKELLQLQTFGETDAQTSTL